MSLKQVFTDRGSILFFLYIRSILKKILCMNSNFTQRLLRMTKICPSGFGHITNYIAVMHNMLKPFEIFYSILFQNQKAVVLGIWFVALGMQGIRSLFTHCEHCTF